MAGPTKYVERDIPQISLRDYPARIDEITAQLCDAAENVGFFGLVDHGIPISEIEAMFSLSEAFFRLPAEAKATVPWSPHNAGWEDRSQVRPSNAGGTAPDNKESYQLQFGEENMAGLWLSDEHLPGFRERCLAFMRRLQAVSEKLMVCFARGLGFEGDDDDYFVRYHDATRPDSQSVLRLLHYYETPRPETRGGEGADDGKKIWHRAGAHTDWGFLTLLFQRPGQGGLEICPGRESSEAYGADASWTRVHFADPASIVCNIGDLLMSWSDDKFMSTLHRVKAPSSDDDYYGERFSIAFFNQACRSAVIQGPKQKYPAVTGEQFIARAMDTHYAALKKARLEAHEKDKGKEEVSAGVNGGVPKHVEIAA